MIVFRGWGILVVVFTAVIGGLVYLATTSISGDPNYCETHNWPEAIGVLLSAVPIYFTGIYLNGRPGRTVIDKATGREMVFRRVHSLFFIPMEYWGLVFALIGILMFFFHF